MNRRAMLAAVSAGVALSPRARAAIQTDPALEAAGWNFAPYAGLDPARFSSTPDGIAVEGTGAGSFIWRPVEGRPECLTWRWRVDHGPPPTDLTQRGGDDRALTVSVGFADWPPDATILQRAQHALAQTQAGDHPLPRAVLMYVWGGTGQEPEVFDSAWMGGLGSARVLRPATTATGRWFEERVDLAADWQASFGSTPPALQEIAIGSDADETNSRVLAMIADIRFTPCG